MYVAEFSMERNGWCVFKVVSDIAVSFHAGAFADKVHAESEAKRLNDIAANVKFSENRALSVSAETAGWKAGDGLPRKIS